MNKKAKILDLISWLNFVLFVGFIIFLIIYLVGLSAWTSNNRQPIESENIILNATLSVFIILLLLSIACVIVCSYFIYKTDWQDWYINSKRKKYFYLNIVLVTLAIPSIIFYRKILNNNLENDAIDESDKSIENNLFFNDDKQLADRGEKQNEQ